MSDMKRLLSSAYMLGYSDARNDKAIDPISAIERLTMNLNKSDLISRQDAIDTVTRYCNQYDLRELLVDIEVLPSAERVGHWDSDCWATKCSECGAYAPCYDDRTDWLSNYCPNCGARMVSEDER